MFVDRVESGLFDGVRELYKLLYPSRQTLPVVILYLKLVNGESVYSYSLMDPYYAEFWRMDKTPRRSDPRMNRLRGLRLAFNETLR